jgi:catechol 2,3-dioxygenase-like lactoylglutathione lyase family enzyme
MPGYRYDHLHLRSPDPERAAAFYTELLGARETTRLDNNGALRIVLDLGGVAVFVEQVPAATPTPPPAPFVGIEHIGLVVDDIAGAIEELRAKGVAILAEPKQIKPGLSIAFIGGPDGVRIELLQRG